MLLEYGNHTHINSTLYLFSMMSGNLFKSADVHAQPLQRNAEHLHIAHGGSLQECWHMLLWGKNKGSKLVYMNATAYDCMMQVATCCSTSCNRAQLPRKASDSGSNSDT